MSVTDKNKIDAMGINPQNPTELCFLISDHFDWVVEENEKADGIHLSLLQDKLNMYAHFIETKQYATTFPNRNFCSFKIEIHFMNEIPEYCYRFLDIAEKQLKELNISIKAIYAPMKT